jgi:ribosomal protein L11 methyltransferase
MDSIQVSIFVSPQGVEPVCGRLYGMGFEQLEIVDSIEDIRAYFDENTQFWDFADYEQIQKLNGQPCVKVYVADDAVGQGQIEEIRASVAELKAFNLGFDPGSLEIKLHKIREDDWANNWKQYFKPLNVGERLLIKPEWEQTDNPENRIILEIEPGMVFGTGSHATTRLCMEKLEQCVKEGDRVLDLGCGSGILAIAALLLGAKEAAGIDIDPNAIAISHENARKNHLEPQRLKVIAGNIIEDEECRRQLGEGYDVVVANIVANVIIGLCPFVPEKLKKDGYFITSGIIEPRLEEVKAALEENGFEILSIAAEEDWRAILSRPKA